MHPQLQQFLLNAGLDFDTPPSDKATWQAFLRLLQADYSMRQKPALRAVPAPAVETNAFEQRLAGERDKLKAVIASLDKGLCVFDIQGRLQLLNAAAKKYLGNLKPLSGENVLAQFRVRDQWNTAYLNAPFMIQLIREGSGLRDADAQLVDDGGAMLPVTFTLTPLVSHRHIIGAVLVFEDICEHKQVEAALMAAKEAAEKASSAKSDFMTSMSHELRTPMNAILGYGDIILEELEDAPEECDPDLIDELQASIHNILNAGRTLLGLINGVLDLSRLESGKMEIHIERTDLVALIGKRLAAMQADLAKAGLRVDNQTAARDPIYAFADPARLVQVLDNLLSNAVKYNRANGSITLKIEHAGAERVRILVEDTGIGISAEQQTQIFQPFVRMSGRNLSVGTGIGLTVSKHLLEVMDGTIGVRSVPGQGSTFWLELPTGVTEAQARGDEADSGRKFLLLYIEDSRTNVSLVAKLFKVRPELALISAPSGEMGVELARLHHPDIILLDINLPGIDGFEVLRRIKAVDSMAAIPVIGLSADDTPEALEQARVAGFYEYMIKPLNKQKFLDTLSTLLGASKKGSHE